MTSFSDAIVGATFGLVKSRPRTITDVASGQFTVRFAAIRPIQNKTPVRANMISAVDPTPTFCSRLGMTTTVTSPPPTNGDDSGAASA